LDVVKRLNRELQENPEADLPEGYIRYTEKRLDVHYNSPGCLSGIQAEAYSILDEIMVGALGFHLIEPEVSFRTVVLAKGAPKKRIEIEQPPIHERPASMLKKGPRRVSAEGSPSHSESTPALLRGTNKLSPTLKLLIAKAPTDEREDITDVAEVLEDVLHSVDLKMTRIVNRGPRAAS
jgi:hypothetical protein